jgi:Zn ribbon nucleic-acid-binding protein
MQCPYCGNDNSDKFIFWDGDDDPYVTCLACNGEFEAEEIEYYQKQSGEESTSEDKLISSGAVIQVLEYEIEWSKGNVHLADLAQDSIDWFIKGLEQAKWLVTEIAKFKPDAPDLSTEITELQGKARGAITKVRPGYMGDYGGIPHGPFDL